MIVVMSSVSTIFGDELKRTNVDERQTQIEQNYIDAANCNSKDSPGEKIENQ